MALVSVRELYLAEAMQTRSRLPGLVDLMLLNPFVTVGRVEKALGLTNQGARNIIRDAERRGWLEELGTWGRGGRTYWLARQIFDIIEAPAIYSAVDPGTGNDLKDTEATHEPADDGSNATR